MSLFRTIDFSAILRALRAGAPLPFTHDPAYVSPQEFSHPDGSARAGT
jgi:hypothetical protein